MQPTLVARAFHRDGWIFEEKIDGWRMLAFKDGDNVQLVSRPGRDHTRRFTDLVNAVRALGPETLILDGEVAIFDERLISRFEWMRHGKPPGVATPPRCSWRSTASTSMVSISALVSFERAGRRCCGLSSTRSCSWQRGGLRTMG